MTDNLLEIIEDLNPYKLEKMLRYVNNFGDSTLDLLGELNQYSILQSKIVNRIISSVWESKTDISGSLFDLSTSYNLIFRNKLSYKEDCEK